MQKLLVVPPALVVGLAVAVPGATAGDLTLLDTTPPGDVHGTPDRPPDHDGWYSHAVTYTFTGTDSESGIAKCDTVDYAGPDSENGRVRGGCDDNAGNRTEVTERVNYDSTKPVVTRASAERAPDHGDWYNHPVTITFAGRDATSQIASCSRLVYSGPDGGPAQVTGTCTDHAGNSASRTVALKYDASAPAKSKVFAVPSDKSISLSWAPPSDGQSFILKRAPAVGGQPPSTVYRGAGHDFVDAGLKNGAKYNYTLTTFDAAGNGSDAAISSVPDGSTLRPFIDTEVTRPPLLTWKKVRGAAYYNVQLFRGRKKVLSIWPRTAKLQLKSRWRYNVHKYKLTSGLYRWYVWPGIGPLSAHKYGDMVGSSTFRMKERPRRSKAGCSRACASAVPRASSTASRAR